MISCTCFTVSGDFCYGYLTNLTSYGTLFDLNINSLLFTNLHFRMGKHKIDLDLKRESDRRYRESRKDDEEYKKRRREIVKSSKDRKKQNMSDRDIRTFRRKKRLEKRAERAKKKISEIEEEDSIMNVSKSSEVSYLLSSLLNLQLIY